MTLPGDHVHSPRATRIVATVGPASAGRTILQRLVAAGVDVFRFNMSHGTFDEHAEGIALVREAARRAGRPAGILIDLQGPKLRTGRNEGGEPIPLPRGTRVELDFRAPAASDRPPRPGSGPLSRPGNGPRSRPGNGPLSRPGRIVITPAALGDALRPGDAVLLDDGRLRLVIEESGPTVQARVARGGRLKERAGVNIVEGSRGGRLSSVLRVPTLKDRRDAAFAVEQRADFVALSFVQEAAEIHRLRALLARLAAGHAGPRASRRSTLLRGGRPPLIVAKLEKPAALRNLDAILDASDALIVARGDLGVELSLEEVPLWQKEILRRARERGVYAITATQMLESMIHAAVPTRAEVSDAANAVLDGTDALMLSAESAVGSYPVESVRMLVRIAEEADRVWLTPRTLPGLAVGGGEGGPAAGRILPPLPRPGSPPGLCPAPGSHAPLEAVTCAAVEMAVRAGARWIVVFTITGRTVRYLTRHRSPVPILALTPLPETGRRLALAWNTRTVAVPPARSTDELMRRGIQTLRRLKLVRDGDRLVLAAGAADPPEATNLLRLVEVGSGGHR